MSISMKMSLPLLSIVVGFSLLLHFYWLPAFLTHHIEDVVEEQQVALQILAIAVEGPLLEGDFANVYTTLNNIKEQNLTWKILTITRRGGQQIYPLSKVNMYDHDYNLVKHTIYKREDPWFDMELYLDLNQRMKDEAKLFYQIELFLLLFCSILFVANLYFQRRLVFRPLQTVINASERLAQGEFNIELPDGKQDETGLLLNAFRKMRDAVLQRQMLIAGAEGRLKAVIENVSNGILTTDRNGVILSTNLALDNIFAYQREELTGHHINELMPDDIRNLHPQYVENYARKAINGAVVKKNREYQGLRKTGKLFPLEITLNEVRVDDEIFFLAVIDDISERVLRRERLAIKQRMIEARATISQLLQQSEFDLKQRFESVLNELFNLTALSLKGKGGVLVYSQVNNCLTLYTLLGQFNDRFIEINRKAGIDYGLWSRAAESGELIVSDYCSDDSCCEHQTEIRQTHGQYIIPLQRSDTLYGVMFLYTDENPSRDPELFIYLRQIAEMMALALSEDCTRLAREDALEKAEAHARAKSEFMANMSHEIRTPLNGMIGSLELLRSSPLEGDERQYVETAFVSSEYLLTLINNILDLSKFEAGQVQLENFEFDLFESMEDLIDLFAPKAREKNLEIGWLVNENVPIRVTGDRTRLWQVLCNLIGNAIKFTEQGSISVELKVAAQNDDKYLIHFSVSDTGMGVPEHAQARIFEAFEQADGSTTRRFGGTGLGLSLCRNLVELMGGEIGVVSRPNAGSTFWFTTKLGSVSEIPVLSSDSMLAGKKMLIVDDIKTNRKLFDKTMQGWQVIHDSTANAEQALVLIDNSLNEQHYDVIILDHMMPDMNGVELAQKIVVNYPGYGAKILLYSSVYEEVYADTMKCNAIDLVLRKPLRRKLLYEHLCWLIAGAGEMNDAEVKRELTEGVNNSLDIEVLLVDDNQVNRVVAQSMLKKLGIVPDVAENGLEAIQLREEKYYNIILMDIQMPVMSGFDATEKIRKIEQSDMQQKSYIIALTANAMEGDHKRCLDAGMDDYLAKPFMLASLKAVINKVINSGSEIHVVNIDAGHEDNAVTLPVDSQDADININKNTVKQLIDLLGVDGLEDTHKTFYKDVAIKLDVLREAIPKNDLVMQKNIFHTLKGSSGNLGMTGFHDMCNQLEQQVKDSNTSITNEELMSLELIYEKSCCEYRTYIDQYMS